MADEDHATPTVRFLIASDEVPAMGNALDVEQQFVTDHLLIVGPAAHAEERQMVTPVADVT